MATTAKVNGNEDEDGGCRLSGSNGNGTITSITHNNMSTSGNNTGNINGTSRSKSVSRSSITAAALGSRRRRVLNPHECCAHDAVDNNYHNHADADADDNHHNPNADKGDTDDDRKVEFISGRGPVGMGEWGTLAVGSVQWFSLNLSVSPLAFLFLE